MTADATWCERITFEEKSSTSHPGGNQVDGLPPAFSLNFRAKIPKFVFFNLQLADQGSGITL